MCGLVASISPDEDLLPSDIYRMLQLANHRGPDGFNIQVISSAQPVDLQTTENSVGWAVLGHVRLAVIDTSGDSSQPMFSKCRRYSLIFNGEIYNYLELRKELTKLGVTFRSTGDTEVLLQALMFWGVQALPRLRGMFAFVFVDQHERIVLAARDRYGIKPLYLWHDGKHLHFASEVKQFTAHPKWKARLERRKALEFLLYGVTDFDQDTHFQHVHHVLPGTYTLTHLRNGLKANSVKWWHPRRDTFTGTYNEAVEEYRRRFQESLSLHMRSDVEVASCLSGGLDSSAIVGSVSALRERPLRTFTAVSENAVLDERRFAEAVNDLAGTIGTYTLPTSEKLWADLDRIMWHQDEPFGSTSIFAQWCVFEAIRGEGIKVALDGQGADEQLGGYNSFITTKILEDFQRRRYRTAFKSARSFMMNQRISVRDLGYAAGYRYLPEGVKSRLGQRAGIASQNAELWIKKDFVNLTKYCDPFNASDSESRTVRQLSWDMVDRINLPLLLRFEDRNSMAFGVEARVPFVDHELMEFALTLPEDFLIRGELTKSILRDAANSRLPEAVKNRRDKIGFQTNEWQWLRQHRSEIGQLIRRDMEVARDVFSDDIQQLVDRQLCNTSRQSPVPWRVVSFLRWMRVFDVSSS